MSLSLIKGFVGGALGLDPQSGNTVARVLIGAANAAKQATVLTAKWAEEKIEAYNTDQKKFNSVLGAFFDDDLDLLGVTDEFYNPNGFKKIGTAILTGTALVAASLVGGVAVLKVTGIGALLMGGLKIVGGFTGKYLGFAIAGLSITGIVSGIIQISNVVLNFNLNVSDNELIEQTVRQIEGLYGLVGSMIGTSLGWLVCGALPNTIMFAFNPMMAAAVMRELDEEGKQEVTMALAQVTQSAFQTVVQAQAKQAFKSTRRWLKARPDGVLGTLARKLMGEENFRRWGESNRPSFTIKKDIIDKQVEAITDPNNRRLVEELVEQFGDSCMEAGLTLAAAGDSFLAAQALLRDNNEVLVGVS